MESILAHRSAAVNVSLFSFLTLSAFLLYSVAQQRENNRLLLQLIHTTGGQAASGGARGAARPSGGSGSRGGPAVLKPLMAVPHRTDLPMLLQQEGFTTGAELGVQVGDFAMWTLKHWPACEKYYLVDLWRQQPNYHDVANVGNDEQERRFQLAKKKVEPWKEKAIFLRMYTTEAAPMIPDDSLDYIYVDARHDYCGVAEDLDTYWPKLRSGGILAGHDYITAAAPRLKISKQDWSVCMNGTKNVGAVKGAVDEFARKHGLTLLATYWDGDFPSWFARKP